MSNLEIAVANRDAAQSAHEAALAVAIPALSAFNRAQSDVWDARGLQGLGYSKAAEAAFETAKAAWDAAHVVTNATQAALEAAQGDLMVAVVLAAIK